MATREITPLDLLLAGWAYTGPVTAPPARPLPCKVVDHDAYIAAKIARITRREKETSTVDFEGLILARQEEDGWQG